MVSNSGKIKVTFLGTGTSQGVPIIACKCDVCCSNNLKDKRLRSSVHIEVDGLSLIIDSGPDFRQQVLREHINTLDAIIFTHDHKDHTGGLDDVRAFNYIQKKPMQVFAEPYVLDTIRREYAYAFAEKPYPGVPQIDLNAIGNKPFYIAQTLVEPIRGMHYKLPMLGYKFGQFAYLTDMNAISDEELNKIKGIDTLVINALRLEKHISHFNLEEALEVIQKANVKHAYLTHIGHQLGLYDSVMKNLPSNVQLAYDGLKIEV